STAPSSWTAKTEPPGRFASLRLKAAAHLTAAILGFCPFPRFYAPAPRARHPVCATVAPAPPIPPRSRRQPAPFTAPAPTRLLPWGLLVVTRVLSTGSH